VSGKVGIPGEALARLLAARGCACEPAEAARVADLLLDLIASGVLRPDAPARESQPRGSQPKSTPSGVLGSGARGAAPEPALETAPAYNMGQSVCIDGEDS
jgi:hypothetical protein